MKKEFAKKIKEALLSALPIILIVLILHFTKIAPISNQQDFIIFLICSIFLILGIGLFSLGSDMSMMPMGEYVKGNYQIEKIMVGYYYCSHFRNTNYHSRTGFICLG